MKAAPAKPHNASNRMIPSPAAKRSIPRRISCRAFQPLQRLEDLYAALRRLFTLLALAVDDLFRRALDEVGIAELGVDALDVGLDFVDFLFQPRLLRRDVDDALERERRD